MAIALRQSRMILLSSTSAIAVAAAAVSGALSLLVGETDGFAIDATTTAADALYIGGPTGGTVAVKDTGTPGNNLSNVALDSSNLVQSGTSPKMVQFPTSPYVRWAPHNLAEQSQTIGSWNLLTQTNVSSNSTTAPDGTVTADTITHTGSGPTCRDNSIALSANVVYTYSLYAKINNGNFVWLQLSDFAANAFGSYFNISTGATATSTTAGDGVVVSASIVSAGSGWYRCSVTGSMGAHSAFPAVLVAQADNGASANGDAAYIWGAQVVRGYNANPYLVTTSARIGIPQSYDTAASKYGVLVERAGTNVQLYSNTFTNAQWTKTRCSMGSATGPDGSTGSYKIVEDSTAANSHGIAVDFAGIDQTIANGQVTMSLYAKAAEREWIVIFDGYTGSVAAWYHLSGAGTVGTVQGSSDRQSIQLIGGGWYRIENEYTVASGHTLPDIFLADADNSLSYNGDGSSGLLVYGVQVEVGSVATSYIPTLGSTVTRAADRISAALTTIPAFSTNVSASLWVKVLAKGSSGTVLLALEASGEQLATQDNTGGNFNIFNVVDGGAAQASINGTLVVGTATKVAWSAAANDFAAAQDAVLGTPDVSGTMPTPTTLYVSYDASSTAYQGNHYLYNMVVVPRTYSDVELQAKTT